MMPQIDGYEFVESARELNSDIPIIFMTAREDFESKRKGFGVGIIRSLVLGVGMCCIMVWTDKFFVLGIIVGIIGMIAMAVAYSLYVRITKRQRDKIAPIILKLSEELKK